MTALMDKRYIKVDQKDVSYKPLIYQKRGRGQNRQNFRTTIGEEIGCIAENMVIIVIEVMDEVEVILEEVVFEVGPVVTLEEIIIEIEVERIRDLGDGLDCKKEE